jgi:plasmid stabilization system protein ParE
MFGVRLTLAALEDLQRIEGFRVELALQHGDFDLPARALDVICSEMRILKTNPYTCRMAQDNPFERELIRPFDGSGYVALLEIAEHEVAVMALRHQREDDDHCLCCNSPRT